MNETTQTLPCSHEWNVQKLKDLFAKSTDVHVLSYQFGHTEIEVLSLHCEGLCDSAQIIRVVLPELEALYEKTGFSDEQSIKQSQALPFKLEESATARQIAEFVYEGTLVLFFPYIKALFTINLSNPPKRTPEESSTEISIKGPKDGFVEDIVTNVALIRKRIRSNSLCYESYVIGERTRTKIGLLYIDDIISPNVLNEARKRLSNINVDGIYGINQLEGYLADTKNTIFPLLDYTGRPDFAINALLAGRFIIIADGNPSILIAPATFTLLLKSPEDVHFNFLYVSFARLIRILSLALALFLPGFWVALTVYHQDQIPFSLLATIVSSRIGIPFPAAIEMILLLLLLEIFREAGFRMPSNIGQTLTVVGGLIIGDAAIRSGLVSPSVVVVGAITAVSGSTLINQGLSNTVSVIRLIFFLSASILGVYGLLLSMLLLISHLAKLKSFGIPYLSPLSPPIFKDLLRALVRLPWNFMRTRPKDLHVTDPDTHREDTK